MKRARAMILLAPWLVFAAGCGTDDDGGPGPTGGGQADAGVDATLAPDVGVDAALAPDAGSDAGDLVDAASAPDSGPDGGSFADVGPDASVGDLGDPDVAPADAGATDAAAFDSGPADLGAADLGGGGLCTGDLGGVEPGPAPRASTRFDVREVIGQLYVWNAEPDTALELLGPDGAVLATAEADYQGSWVFRGLAPGLGYHVRPADDPDDFAGPLEVLSVEESLPSEAFYCSQRLEPGFQYITMRDGTTLSTFVHLPGPPEDGPYPTLVNYSGYSPSRPGQSMGEEVAFLCDFFPILCNAPEFPSGLIMGLMGYAVVGVNVRGTGCSGGAYDYFDPPQIMDGYDVVEIVARQPWVKHGRVGMVGLSFPGITQLFVAAARPPHLAAIAPMSVLADTGSSTLRPGGIYNDGFAQEWIQHVLNRAEPYGHGWIRDVVDSGDAVCEENQKLHSQLLDAVTKGRENPFYTDDVARPVDPSSFVDRIEVPVFLTGQTQDEQTGPHFPALFDRFDSSPFVRFTITNGVHDDGFCPQIVADWTDFLALYVAREVPWRPDGLEALVPVFMTDVYGAALTLPPALYDDMPSYADALAAYEAEPAVRVIFETGAAPGVAPAAPQGTFERRFDAWPLPETVAVRWHLQPDGSLGPDPPAVERSASSFVHDPGAGDRVTLASGSVRNLPVDWAWPQPTEGSALSWLTPPLEDTLVMVGHGSVDLWVQSTASDADLEVCLSEVRPDGAESYVQCGWLRASHRALRDDATELRPVKTHRQEDVADLPPGAWTPVRVELMPFVHIFRSGSRIRLTVDTPGDSMARWRFELLEYDAPPTHSVAHDGAHPSSVALSLIPGVDVPTELPPCESLRGQPCRPYVPLVNRPFE